MSGRRFPIFISLEEKRVLVVGGGQVAARRVNVLLSFGAAVTVVSPKLCPQLAQMTDQIEWRQEHYSGIAQDYMLIIAATNDRQVNRQIGVEAKALGLPVSVADAKEESTFWFPAIARGAGVVAGIVSEDGDHRRARQAAKLVREALKGEN
ncbi:MAG: NAD(P)-dependent oxidoreductase [Oscillospiraceae bacterium]|nr:NAD(P)-dependent oxidoreductase [Oscillospiraceae bacterium]